MTHSQAHCRSVSDGNGPFEARLNKCVSDGLPQATTAVDDKVSAQMWSTDLDTSQAVASGGFACDYSGCSRGNRVEALGCASRDSTCRARDIGYDTGFNI